MKIKSALVVFLSLVWLYPKAQTGNANYFEPNVFPSSPNTAAFTKYGSYPVNMYSGVPDISIPLYTIESGGLKVPITLSYHASGIRVSDAASWVGLGWSLNCGGTITRKVWGIPDDFGYLIETKRSLSNINLQNNNDLDYVRETVEDKLHDNMPDIYSYQIPGYNGKFFYDADSSFKIMMVPRSPLSVVGTHGYNVTNSCNCYNQKFTITDENGNIYGLGGTYQEYTYTPSIPALPTETSAWMLESMISQNRRDTISFQYTPSSYQLPDGTSETITVEDDVSSINGYGTGYSANTTPVTEILNNPATVTEQQLTHVYFKNGRIDFVRHPTLRQDVNTYELDTLKVSIYNFGTKEYELQKSIVFVKSYFGTGGPGNVRLRLDTLKILDKASSIVNQYSFSYNNSVTLPPYVSLARDYWGYYNGKDNSTDLIPQTTIQMISGGLYNITIGNPNDPNSSCRNIDTTKMQACMLTSITYPTGGHTNFTYQTNRYIDNNNVLQLAGGLRIYQISSYDSQTSTTPIVKTYQYNTAYANFFYNPSLALNYGMFVNSQTYRDWVSLAGPNPDEIGGFTMGATKRVRRYYSQPNEDLDLDGVPVAYTQVTEYTGTPLANIGKSIFTFSYFPSNSLQGGGGETGLPLIYDFSFLNGKLTSKTDYSLNTNGSYQVVKAVTNTYGAWPSFYYDGVGVAMGQHLYNDGALSGGSAYYQQETPDDEQTYPLGDFAIQSGDTYLTSTITTLYDQNDVTKYSTSSINYNYDNLTHQQVSRTYHTDSKGNTIVSVNKYPADYLTPFPTAHATTNNAALDTMYYRNMQASVIEKWDTLKNVATGVSAVTSAQLNQYKFGYIAGTIVPATISTLSIVQPLSNFTPAAVVSGNLTGDSRYAQMIGFDQYDTHNNIIQYTPRNATPTSILWDYQYENPVAQVKNATTSYGSYTQVAYTSFEANGQGNWVYSGTPVFDPTAPTGTMVYPLSAGNITSPSTLTPGTAYVLSYWSNNGPATVSCYVPPNTTSLTGTALNNHNGWTYYECQVPAGATLTISGTTSIDDLRLYPAAAQMTTYTFDPSGLRSIADTKGSVNYFEYDYFQRLKNVKDWNGNIVKNYGYHTYDQTIGNDAQPLTTFTRNNCPPNTSPQSTTYSVPANRYFSSTKASANAEATYDLNYNGQTNANNPTICGCPVVNVSFAVNNSTAANFTVTFSGVSPSYTINPGANTLSVPPGTYSTLTVQANDSNTHTYTLSGGGGSVGPAHIATFNNVVVQTGQTDLTLTIQ